MNTEQLEEAEPGGPRRWAEEYIASWLAEAVWAVEDLVDLLQGQRISAPQPGEPPYLRLLDALPEGADRCQAETELARRAAVLLSQKPVARRIGGGPPERLLYNLLLLCAGLACPDQLAEPLFKMWQHKSVIGEWEGLDLRSALCAALASNQIDSRMASEWRLLLQGKTGEFLLANEFDGFEGLIWMPESPEKRGEPNLAAIGEALKGMTDYLEPSRERRPEFRSLWGRVEETYPDRANWGKEFVILANQYHFPGWAVESLPHLFLPSEKQRGGKRVLMVWNLLASCLKLSRQEAHTLCEGRLVEVEVPEAMFAWVSGIALRVEDRRRAFPLASEKGLHGAVLDLLADVEEQETEESNLEHFRQGRKENIEQLRAA